MSLMTPEHPRWDEFCERLEGPEGCNFVERVPGDVSTVTWRCGGGTDKSYARQILAAMGFSPGLVEGSLLYFEKHGGYCSCEILFNVDPAPVA